MVSLIRTRAQHERTIRIAVPVLVVVSLSSFFGPSCSLYTGLRPEGELLSNGVAMLSKGIHTPWAGFIKQPIRIYAYYLVERSHILAIVLCCTHVPVQLNVNIRLKPILTVSKRVVSGKSWTYLRGQTRRLRDLYDEPAWRSSFSPPTQLRSKPPRIRFPILHPHSGCHTYSARGLPRCPCPCLVRAASWCTGSQQVSMRLRIASIHNAELQLLAMLARASGCPFGEQHTLAFYQRRGGIEGGVSMSAKLLWHQPRPGIRMVAGTLVAYSQPRSRPFPTLVVDRLLKRYSNPDTLVEVFKLFVDGSLDPWSGTDLACV